jgi:hypothetical protein
VEIYRIEGAALKEPRYREIARYWRADLAHAETRALLESCVAEATPALSPAVCFTELDVCVRGDEVAFAHVRVKSRDLARYLAGAEKMLLFAATLGARFERLLQKYVKLAPARALCFDALGSERIEALCDTFCEEMGKQYGESGVSLKPRFSPGYGDVPLSLQREVTEILQCHRHVGIGLTEGLLMTPSKSVTAFVALKSE